MILAAAKQVASRAANLIALVSAPAPAGSPGMSTSSGLPVIGTSIMPLMSPVSIPGTPTPPVYTSPVPTAPSYPTPPAPIPTAETIPNPTMQTPAATQVVPVLIATTPGVVDPDAVDERPFYKRGSFWACFAGGVAAGAGLGHLWSKR